MRRLGYALAVLIWLALNARACAMLQEVMHG